MPQIACHHCQHLWTFESPLGRREECPQCHYDAKVCLNCTFYDSQAYRECREPQASWVREKDKANFCGYFVSIESRTKDKGQAEDLKKKLEDLFKS